MAKKAQIIPPRSDLRQKAVNFSKGLDLRLDRQVLVELEKVVHKSTDKIIKDIADRLAAMRLTLKAVSSKKIEAHEARQAIFSHSHAIKGIGGTIGFDLLTSISKSLNDIAGSEVALTKRMIKILDLHIDALYVVVAKRIKGVGGQVEEQVVQSFDEARRKFS